MQLQLSPETNRLEVIGAHALPRSVMRSGKGRTAEGEPISIGSFRPEKVTTPRSWESVFLSADINGDHQPETLDIQPDGTSTIRGHSTTTTLAKEIGSQLFLRIGTMTEAREISGPELSDLLAQVRKNVQIER